MATDLKSIVGDSPKITNVISDLSAGGGLVYSRIGYLLVSDLGAPKILKWNTGGGSVFREKSDGTGGVTLDHQGRLITAGKRQVCRTEKDGGIAWLGAGEGAFVVVFGLAGGVCFSGAGGVFWVPRR